MLRHGLAALVVLALLAPLTPAAHSAMACCRGKGEACVCPLDLGFSRCETAREISPQQAPPALLPPGPPALALSPSREEPRGPFDVLVSLARPPRVPPPRA